MNKHVFVIIEIGNNNTKTHIYEDEKVIYENNTTIEFKKNYQIENKINETDLSKLYTIIKMHWNIQVIFIYIDVVFLEILKLKN